MKNYLIATLILLAISTQSSAQKVIQQTRQYFKNFNWETQRIDKYRYNTVELNDSIIGWFIRNDTTFLDRLAVKQYNSNQEPDTFTKFEWDDKTKKWDPIDRAIYSYINNEIDTIQYDNHWGPGWDHWTKLGHYRSINLDSTDEFLWQFGTWRPGFRTVHIWQGGKEIKKIKKYWDTNRYVPSEIKYKSYDSSGNLIEIRIETLDPQLWVFRNSSKEVRTFNSNGDIVTKVHSEYTDSTGWKQEFRISYFYSGGLLDFYILEGYDHDDLSWVLIEKVTYKYDFQFAIDQENAKRIGLAIYPNPISNDQELMVSGDDLRQITILNSSGQKQLELLNLRGQTPITLDISDLTPGFYFIRTVDHTGQINTKKLVVN